MPTKILLADDSMTAQKMGKEILTSAGYEVVAVSNGAAAAKKLADKYGVIILDINMPGYTGFELCEKIRANMESAKTPVLLTIGKMEHYEPTEVQRVKADGVIIKPFEATDLLATVQKLIEKSAPAKPDYEKTVILKRAQLEEFKDQSYNDWKSESEPQPAPKPAMDMSRAEASAPAFGMDMDEQEEAVAPVPVAAAPASEIASSPAFEMMSAPELTNVESSNIESLLQSAPPAPAFEAALPRAVPIAPPSFSSGTGRDPNLESLALEHDEAPAYAIPAKDPALAARIEMTNEEFVAKTATEPAPSAPASSDAEFEARVAAAMSTGYEHVEEVVEPQPEIAATQPVMDAAPPAMTTAPAMEVAAPQPESAIAVPEPESGMPPMMAEPPDYERTVRIQAHPEMEIETSAAPEPTPDNLEIPSDPLIERLSDRAPDTAIEASAAASPARENMEAVADPLIERLSDSAPELVTEATPTTPDIALVEQMNAAFKDLPVEMTPHVVEEPIVAASPEPVEIAPPKPPSRTTGHDLELASALAAAVGADAPATMAAAASAGPSPNATIVDPNLIAAAVHRAMAKMMPAIMTEVAKELDPDKK